jgi:acyl-coenzyme A thioesterase PaaI-like protein
MADVPSPDTPPDAPPDGPPAAERQAERDAVLDALAGSVPFNRHLGVRFDRLGDELTGRLPFRPGLVGNPLLPALHGGVTGSFLEITALVQLAWDQVLTVMQTDGEAAEEIRAGRFPPMPKTIDVNIDYLRSGGPRETFARATVQRAGRRFAHLHVVAWQDNRSRPIAMLRGNFLMPGED